MRDVQLEATRPGSQTETLYYDGQCPLCRAEMDRLAKSKSSSLELVDIHHYDADEATRHQMLRRLHLEGADGVVRTGLDANVAAWRHTRWGFAWRWLRWPLIRWFADMAYNTWAEHRYSRRYQTSPPNG